MYSLLTPAKTINNNLSPAIGGFFMPISFPILGESRYMDYREAYLHRSQKVRGVVIAHCCMIERRIDSILTKYFAKDDYHQRQLMEFLFCTEKLSLKSKIALLSQVCIAKLKNKKLFDIIFECFDEKFRYFSAERNLFAHDMDILMVDEMAKEDLLNRHASILMPFKKTVTLEFYTEKDIDDFVTFTEHLYDIIDKIRSIILPNGDPHR